MGRFKATWAFAFLVILMVVYVVWDFTEFKKLGDIQEGEVMLTEFGPESVTKLEVLNKNKISIELKGEDCLILEPVNDHCDLQAVETFIGNLSPLKGQKVLDSKELESKREEFGLNPTEGTQVTWTLNGGKSQSILIGSKNTFDGSYYVLMNDVYVVDRKVAQLTNKGLEQFRSRTLWRGPSEIQKITSISQNQNNQFELERKDSKWVLKNPSADHEVSEKRIEEWIEQVRKIKGVKVHDDVKSKTSSKVATFKFNDSYQIDFFNENDVFFGSEDASSRRVEIPKERLKKILVPKSYFYDVYKPFTFPLEKVSEVEFKEPSRNLKFIKSDQEWAPRPAIKDFDEGQLTLFFQKLLQLEVANFDGLHESMKFKPKGSLLLKDSQGNTVFEMIWGQSFKSPDGPFVLDSLTLVKLSTQKGVVTVLDTQLVDLLQTSFTKKDQTESEKHDHVH